MAVTIDLDVDASGATGSIGAVASSLKGLEMVANDLDIDLDADIGDITDEIDKFSEALANLDVDMNNLTRDLNEAVEKLDGAEIGVNVNNPSGNTGGGDSTGGDPPVSAVDFSTFGDDVRTGGATSDGGKAASIFERTYGPDAIHISDADIGEMLKGGAGSNVRTGAGSSSQFPKQAVRKLNSGLRNFGESSSIVPDYDPRERTAMRSDMGLEPLSMGDRRLRAAESYRELGDMHGIDIRGDKDRSMFGGGDMEISDLKKAAENMGGFGSKLSKLKPTMGKYMQLLAALIPIAVVLGTQLLGVAAAMGAVAVAGGAIMGLGLLGHADSMAGSVQQAKNELRDLKGELFDTFQPTMQQFAPIQSEMFDSIPDGLDPIAEKMEMLTTFKPLLFDLGAALSGGMVEALDIIERNSGAVKQLTSRFAGLLGTGLLDFFEFLIQSAARNQDLLVSFGSALINLAVVAYNVSLAVSKILNVFSPLAGMLAWLSDLLNNKFILAMLSAVTVTYLTAAAFSKLGLAVMAALSKIGILGSGSFLGTVMSGLAAMQAQVAGLIAEYTALSAAASMAAAAIAMTGIGLLAVGAGTLAAGAILNGPNKSDGRFQGGSGDNVYNDNRSITVNSGGGDTLADTKQMERVVSRASETNNATSRPDVNSSGVPSDGGSN
jgi:hypothetical protein